MNQIVRLNWPEVSPAGAKALYGVHRYISRDTNLPEELIHLVFLRVSQMNGCAHCIDATSSDVEVLRAIETMPDWHGGVWNCPLLDTGVLGARAQGASNAAGLCEPYVKRQKNDAADAEAICEAVMRQTMRFVPIKSVEQQSAAMLHRSRALLVKQRTMLLHSICSHLAELGISTGAGISQIARIVRELARGERTDLPRLARFVLEALARLVCHLADRLQAIEKKLVSWHFRNDLSNRLETMPGVGFVTASVLASIVPPGIASDCRRPSSQLRRYAKRRSASATRRKR